MDAGLKPRSAIMGLSVTAAAPAWGYGNGYHYGSGMMYGGGLFGWLVMIIIIVLVVAVVVSILRWRASSGHRFLPAPHKSALEILEERFARSEIDKEEFEEKRRTLSR